jgi:hypothetical protein
MFSKYLDAVLLLSLGDVTRSAVRFLRTAAVLYVEENVSVCNCPYAILLTLVLLTETFFC